MAKTETKLAWSEIDPSTLEPATSAAYLEFKAQNAIAKVLRAKLEKLLNDDAAAAGVTDGTTRLAVGHHFGKLSIALAPREAKTVSRKAVAFSALAAFGRK